MKLRDSHRGVLLGLGAAALFGLSAPLAKALLGEMSPQVLAGLLYLGGGLGLTAYRRVHPSSARDGAASSRPRSTRGPRSLGARPRASQPSPRRARTRPT